MKEGKMEILYITNIPSPYRVEFFRELSKYCELTVIYDRAAASDRDCAWAGDVDGEDTFHSIVLQGINAGHDMAFSFGILPWLRKGYDHIIIGVYSSPTAMLAIEYLRWKKLSFILNADGGFIKNDRRFTAAIKRHFIGSASAWLGTGAPTADYLEHYGAKRDKIYDYPFTSLSKSQLFFPSAKQRREAKDKLGFKEQRLVLSVGSFIPRKGFELLIKAGKGLSDNIGIVIIGGSPTKEYESLVTENHPDHVHFVGFKVWNELKEYYIAADLFVLPTKEDIWGLVVNEAMAFGLPVVSSQYSIAGQMLVKDGETGYLTDPHNTDRMAEYIMDILTIEGEAERMGGNAYELIQGYTIEQMAVRHIELLTSLNRKSQE